MYFSIHFSVFFTLCRWTFDGRMFFRSFQRLLYLGLQAFPWSVAAFPFASIFYIYIIIASRVGLYMRPCRGYALRCHCCGFLQPDLGRQNTFAWALHVMFSYHLDTSSDRACQDGELLAKQCNLSTGGFVFRLLKSQRRFPVSCCVLLVYDPRQC